MAGLNELIKHVNHAWQSLAPSRPSIHGKSSSLGGGWARSSWLHSVEEGSRVPAGVAGRVRSGRCPIALGKQDLAPLHLGPPWCCLCSPDLTWQALPASLPPRLLTSALLQPHRPLFGSSILQLIAASQFLHLQISLPGSPFPSVFPSLTEILFLHSIIRI